MLLSGCGNLFTSSNSLNSISPQVSGSEAAQANPFQKKAVNDQGGYFCSDGTTAWGPLTQRMIAKCRDWKGGNACNNSQWSEELFLKAYGDGQCPDGARFNSITGYCVEGNNTLGPFSPTLIKACQDSDGGNSCKTNRWNSGLLYNLMRSEGLISPPKRPPQYVLLAFDGAQSLDAWKKSRNFAQEMEDKGIDLHFTYFISAVYFVSRDNRKLYNAPAGKGVGRSAIGWGGKPEDIALRLDQVNLAYQEGHEIASHAVGHFNGNKWSEADWTKEFDYFDQFIFEAYKINGLSGSLAFDRSAIEGFRAPELGKSPGLFKTLQKNGFRYDTSKEDNSNYWPEKQNGVWNFPLASLMTALTRKRVLSMDYNFYYAHSKAKPNPSNAKRYEEDTFQTYMKYFENNYSGNRAPIHIGHHFSAWNNGAYWNALFRFAEKVCGQPEVECVTYRELADFMDSLTPEQIAAYQKGNFPQDSTDETSVKPDQSKSMAEIRSEISCQL